MDKNTVPELRIVGSGKNIFDTDMKYTIPLYQRAYAWEDKQLIQLVEDIYDVSDNAAIEEEVRLLCQNQLVEHGEIVRGSIPFKAAQPVGRFGSFNNSDDNSNAPVVIITI